MLAHVKFHGVSEFLRHCCQTKNLLAVKELHANVLKSSFFSISPGLQINILFTYTACGSSGILNSFLRCLNPRNPIPFNAIISHFSRNGFDRLGLHTLSFMHYNNVLADSYSLCSALKSACVLKDVWFGKLLHAYVVKSGWITSVFVGSALVDFLCKLNWIKDAAMVFDEIPVKNTVCVNALMSGYSEAKMWDQVIELTRRMLPLNLDVDSFTLSSILRACCGLSALQLCKQVHAKAIRNVVDVENDVFLQSLLIEAYGKCGVVENSEKVFRVSRNLDLILWTSMLGVHGRNGNYKEVTNLFSRMLLEGINPDGVAFITVLSACSYTGQVNLGIEYFELMTRDFGLVPSQEHCGCVVDMLCRAGDLERACEFMSRIHCNEDHSFSIAMWGALVNACIESGNVEFGKIVAERALELEPNSVSIYVLLSNLYARNSMWDEIEGLRRLMKSRGLKKDLGWSCI